jgi:hypothetical protein
MAPFRTDEKSETLWCLTFEGKPLTFEILLDFFFKAHGENFDSSIIKTRKGENFGSVQPVIQALLYYLANASQISQLEDLLLDHSREGSNAWIRRQLQQFKLQTSSYVDLTKEQSTQTILGANVRPFKFKEIEIIGRPILLSCPLHLN